MPPHKNFTVTKHQNSRQKSPRQVIYSASWELEFNYTCFWESFSLVEYNTCEPAQQHFQIKGFQLSAESWKFLFSGVSFFYSEVKTVCKKHTFLTQKIILIKKIVSTDFFGPFLQWIHAGFPFSKKQHETSRFRSNAAEQPQPHWFFNHKVHPTQPQWPTSHYSFKSTVKI